MLFTKGINWEGEDAYIVGGGTSLSHFPFSVLKGRNVIGCNASWRLGADICPIVFFGDIQWWERWKEEVLNEYEGLLFSYHPFAIETKNRQIYGMPKANNCIRRGHISWYQNSGASALVMAAQFGAKRIYLLGFDMKLGSNGKNNYHDDSVFPIRREVFPKFKKGFDKLSQDLKLTYPDLEVFNLNPDSDLDVFKQKLPIYFRL